MRHKGNKNMYITLRNNDLHKKYKDIIKHSEIIPSKEIFRRLVSLPANRFYVSEERAYVVIKKMTKGDCIREMKAETKKMYHDMFCIVKGILSTDKTISLSEAISKTLNNAAPSFYLTESSARVIISRIKNKRYEIT